MSKIIFLIGIPGSGKTYWANHNSGFKTIIVNRDSMRLMLFGGRYIHDKEVEMIITHSILNMIENAVTCGFNIIIDNVNIGKKYRDDIVYFVNNLPSIKVRNETVEFEAVYFIPNTFDVHVNNRMLESKGQFKTVWQKVINKFMMKMESLNEIKKEFKNKVITVQVENYSIKNALRKEDKNCITSENPSGECAYGSCERDLE